MKNRGKYERTKKQHKAAPLSFWSRKRPKNWRRGKKKFFSAKFLAKICFPVPYLDFATEMMLLTLTTKNLQVASFQSSPIFLFMLQLLNVLLKGDWKNENKNSARGPKKYMVTSIVTGIRVVLFFPILRL